MSVRRAVIGVESTEGLNVREFCEVHGISRDTFYRLRREARLRGSQAALAGRSRAPHRVANKTAESVEDRIVELRKQLADFGADAGPGSIWDRLDTEMDQPPSQATIWRVLARRGFITPNPAKAPKRPLRRFTASRANECWQIDDTSWELSSGDTVKIINIIDDHSRVCVASVGVSACTGPAAFIAFDQAGRTWGLPERFLSDNAPEFKRALAGVVNTMGVRASHSKPYHPQTCGKVERFHQTVKTFLSKRTAVNLTELQTHLDTFTEFYNHQRPHRSLGRRPPATVFAQAPKSGPADHPIDQPMPSTAVWTSTVINGVVHIPGDRRVTIGAAYNGQPALSILTGDKAHVFINGTLQRTITITANQRSYPLHTRPGRPT